MQVDQMDSTLGLLLDIVRNDGDILEVEGSVNLVHEVQRCRLEVVQCKHKREAA